MIKSPKTAALVLILILGWSFRGAAQTVQYVTVLGGNTGIGNNFPVQTNQLVSLVGYSGSPNVTGDFPNGAFLTLNPPSGSGIFSGLTNITVQTVGGGGTIYPGAATFQITTPSSANVVSNYVPADAIVIPASATGNVQIILESSVDLVNWTAASPGTYGASSATNRFFRVRAVHN